MTEKTLKYELYKHGSYLISLKESGSSFVNIDEEIKKLEELFQLASKKEDPMTEKTMLQKIRSLAQAAVNADDDQEQFSNLMRIIELTETDTPPFAVGEYYFDKDVNRIVKIENHETGYTEIKYLSGGKLQNSVLYNLADYFDKWTPATAEQIATFKRAEQFAAKGRKLDEFDLYDQVFDPLHGTGEVVAVDSAGEIKVRYDYSCESVEHWYTRHTCDQLDLIQTAEELQEVGE